MKSLIHCANALANSEFTDLEQRKSMFGDALTLAMQDSVRIWLVDRLSFSPYKSDITVASDLAGGIYGSWLWPDTLNRGGEAGGSVTIAMPAILNDPWNPVNGSNFIYDTMLIRSTGDQRHHAGSVHRSLLAAADRTRRSHRERRLARWCRPWIGSLWTLTEEITVPEDAWVDWDATEQRFITAGEKFPEGLTANRKSITYYPEDFFDIKWHDGSTMSMGDLVLGFILNFDQGKEGSAIFDEAQVPTVENFLEHLPWPAASCKRIRWWWNITAISTIWTQSGMWSVSTRTCCEGLAHGTRLPAGMLAEINDELAFSADKAEATGSGMDELHRRPSLEILAQEAGSRALARTLSLMHRR